MNFRGFHTLTLFSVIILLVHSTIFAKPVSFKTKPVCTREGDKVKISFETEILCDVAVFIEDEDGNIKRHLVAGVLGPNPPAPLTPNSSKQELFWDGYDDDGVKILLPDADLSKLKMRVALGLKPSYAGKAFTTPEKTGPNQVENVMGMTVNAEDGRMYLLDNCGGMVWGGASRVLVFRRDGTYERTIKPFPSNLPVEKGHAAGVFTNAFGKFNPFIHRVQGLAFYPAEEVYHKPTINADGNLVLAVNGTRLATLARDGSIPNETYAGPNLGDKLGFNKYPVLTFSRPGGNLYIAGLGPGKPTATHAIYVIKPGADSIAEPWFGDPAKAGDDNNHLQDASAVAVDNQGKVFVADRGNNRIVVLNEATAKVTATYPVDAPSWVGVHGKSGSIYIQSDTNVVKMSKDGKIVTQLPLPPHPNKSQIWKFAVDENSEPPVLWAGVGSNVWRAEDSGNSFTELKQAGAYAAELYWRPDADPLRKTVLCKIGGAPGYGARLEILNEESGNIERTFRTSAIAGKEGRNHRLGADGCIYFQDHGAQAGGVMRLNPDGTPKPFQATVNDPYLRGRLPVGFTGTTMWERDFSVDRKGNVYVRASGPEYHGLMTVHLYDSDGNFKRFLIYTVSDGMYGPRVDLQGNLYIMDAIKMEGQPIPPDFEDTIKRFPNSRDGIDWIYGSVIKFSPAGGAIWFSGNQASPLTYDGWGSGRTVTGLHIANGSLNGEIVKAKGTLNMPKFRLDSAKVKKVTMRLKNNSDGDQATLFFHRLKEGYIASCGIGFPVNIAIKPNSDFTEYTFDLTNEPEWKEIVHNFSLLPSNAGKGTFALDWVRFENGGPALAWEFNVDDNADTKLPKEMAKEKVGAYRRPSGTELQGALWWRDGFSPIGDLGVHNGCHCTGSDFDVDDFGRAFVPDTGRFRVGILDTAGNEITSFGEYGNQDNCGPESYVVDPETGLLRPRKTDDPKTIESPAAEPEIAFAWIIGLAVTDKYAYISDVVNKRVLRIQLGYTTVETCTLK